MRVYLENKKLYVQNEDKLVYKVVSYEGYDGYDSLHYNLELVCGWKHNGWQPAEEFSEDVQTETVIQYFFKEGLEECLEANDYIIIKGNPMEEIQMENKATIYPLEFSEMNEIEKVTQ